MVDILLATYNGGRFLKELLASINDQTYTNWHLLIGDDSSSDNTEKIILDFMSEQPEGKVTFFKNRPGTGSAKSNFMHMTGMTDSDYVMFCDQDDVWHKDKIEKTIERMQKLEGLKPGPVLVHTDLRVVDEKLNVISSSFVSYSRLLANMSLGERLIQNNVTGCTMMVNKELISLMRRASKGGKHILMHDHFAALIAAVFGQIGYIYAPTIDYRQHGGNSVGAAGKLQYIKRRLFDGNINFKQDMKSSCLQVRYFFHLYGDDIKNAGMRKLLTNYGNLYNKGKADRIRFCLENGILKIGTSKKIVQLLLM